MEEILLTIKRYFILACSGALGGTLAALNTKQKKITVLLLAALTGSFVAGMGVPIITVYLNIQNEELRTGIAFFLGTISTPLIQQLASDPSSFWKLFKR